MMKKILSCIMEKTNNFYGNLHIRTKIMLNFLVIIVIVTVTVNGFYYLKATSMVEDELTKTMLGILEQADINIQGVVSSVEDSSFRLYTNLQLREIFRRKKTIILIGYNLKTIIHS